MPKFIVQPRIGLIVILQKDPLCSLYIAFSYKLHKFLELRVPALTHLDQHKLYIR